MGYAQLVAVNRAPKKRLRQAAQSEEANNSAGRSLACEEGQTLGGQARWCSDGSAGVQGKNLRQSGREQRNVQLVGAGGSKGSTSNVRLDAAAAVCPAQGCAAMATIELQRVLEGVVLCNCMRVMGAAAKLRPLIGVGGAARVVLVRLRLRRCGRSWTSRTGG